VQKGTSPIYLVTNPPFKHLSYRFINRAFDGTYPIRRALFLVGVGSLQDAFLEKVDTSRCVLVYKSDPFEADFDIWLDPRKGGAHIPRYKKKKVRLLTYYSMEEYQSIRTKAPHRPVKIAKRPVTENKNSIQTAK
jgi:hypothetical protein